MIEDDENYVTLEVFSEFAKLMTNCNDHAFETCESLGKQIKTLREVVRILEDEVRVLGLGGRHAQG